MLKRTTKPKTVFFSASPVPWKTTSDFCFWNAGPFSLIFFQCKCFLLDVLWDRWTRLGDIWSLGGLISHRSFLFIFFTWCFFFGAKKRWNDTCKTLKRFSSTPFKLQIRLWDSREIARAVVAGIEFIFRNVALLFSFTQTGMSSEWEGMTALVIFQAQLRIWVKSNRLLSYRDLW